MANRYLFGTDGIRGQANVYPMTVEVALGVGRGLAHLVQSGRLGRPAMGQRRRVVIGKDTRLSGYCFEQAIAAGLCSMGVDVMLVGPLPTPGIAFITQSMRADAGVVVSASHNPYDDNGIKIFGHDGFKLPDAIEIELEKLILQDSISFVRPTGEGIGRATRIDDAVGRYTVFLKSVFPNEHTLDGVKIVLDCAHGAAYRVAPDVFRELGAEVICTGVEPDGTNINHECGAIYPAHARELVRTNRADFGVVLDGDADRVVLVDEKGAQVHGDAVIALLALDLEKRCRLGRRTVVSTVMSNMGLEQCLTARGIGVIRTQVGDRYVVERMREGRFNFGGEDSGHLILLDHARTGDGIVAALLVASHVLRQNKPLSELASVFEPFPRVLLSFGVPQKIPLDQLQRTQGLMRDAERQLGSEGRLFVRYSGTEKKARVLVEGQEQKLVETLAHAISEQMQSEIAHTASEPSSLQQAVA